MLKYRFVFDSVTGYNRLEITKMLGYPINFKMLMALWMLFPNYIYKLIVAILISF